MGEVYLNGNVLKSATIDGKPVKKVYLNDTLVKTFTWGTATVSFRWGYSDYEYGTGCDSDIYWYPLVPQVYVSLSDTTNVSDVKIQTYDDDDFYSDCITPVAKKISINLNTWVDLPIGSRTWSHGSTASDCCYINPNFSVNIYNGNEFIKGIEFFDSTYHMRYRDTSHSGSYYTLDTKSGTY